jgi:toxin ParE1/3/4
VKTIRWLRLALADLDELMVFIAADRPEAAAAMAAKIWQAVQRLTGQPAMGRLGRVPGTRELVVAGTPFIVPYRCIGGEIQILRVLHGARKWPAVL